VSDVAAAMKYLAGRSEADGRAGMIGFSMGGHIAYLAATALDLVATAVLYAGWLTNTEIPLSRPEPTLTRTPGIGKHGGRILYVVGAGDKLIDAAQVAAIDAALTDAAVPHEVVVEPGAEHAFLWEGTPSFHRRARDDSWRRVEAFFDDAFGRAAVRTAG
jgi:carboxymethylenebutenolidase